MFHRELFHVDGLMCGMCLAEVLERLHDVEGVADVGISLRAGGRSPVVIRRDELVLTEELASAVNDAGFTLTDDRFRSLPTRQGSDNLRHDRDRNSADWLPIGADRK